jgi:P22 coat protein - gene protein 5
MMTLLRVLVFAWLQSYLNCIIKFANTYITIGMATKEALRVLVNNLAGAKRVNREYDDKFGVEGAKIGQVLNIRRPPRYLTALGQALVIEDATETTVPLVLNTQRHLGLAFSSVDLALSIDEFSKRFIRPGISTLANYIDFDVLGQYINAFNEIGTPGTVPNLALTYLQVGQRLSEMSVPFQDRCVVISPGMNAVIVDALKGLFQSSEKIREQYDEGMMGEGLGFDWYLDQNVRVQQVGAYAGGSGPQVNGAGQTGSIIATNGWPNAQILNQGDIITFAGVFAVNAQNRQSTGALAQWVVTQNVTAAGNAANIPIQGPLGNGIITAGPFMNCTNSPANAAAITVQGASGVGPSPRGLAFHPDAITLGMADLVLPGGVDIAERASSKELKASLRLIRAYDINMDRFPFRADVLYGVATLYPELMCRIAS